MFCSGVPFPVRLASGSSNTFVAKTRPRSVKK
jgi:hypothetical protein